MGLISAFNEILACVLTGLSTSVFLILFARLGWLPIFYLTTEPPKQEETTGE